MNAASRRTTGAREQLRKKFEAEEISPDALQYVFAWCVRPLSKARKK
jgi:hypothetical protein